MSRDACGVLLPKPTPKKVQDLKLTLEYVGGIAVYVNGREVRRAHLPPGELKPDTLAERYPDDLYCEPDGTFLQETGPIRPNAASRNRRRARRSNAQYPTPNVQ
jgi:hypothetical protein